MRGFIFSQIPDYGTCWNDCDCPTCRPFCSAFNIKNPGYCQTNIRYGRRSMKKSACAIIGKQILIFFYDVAFVKLSSLSLVHFIENLCYYPFRSQSN